MGNRIGSLLAALILTGCGFGDTTAVEGCHAQYGNPPRPFTSTINGAAFGESFCRGGRILEWQDRNGTPRSACLHVPAHADGMRLPLLVYLHPSLSNTDTLEATGFLDRMATADLSGNPARPGFILLAPLGRDTAHYYPNPDHEGLGWDNWYRNLDRDSPTLNVDVATIDHFIAEVKAMGIVDERRVYLSGWSNGSAMAILYGLNTPGIAAAAVYSAPDPYSDFNDPCPQPAFGSSALPIYHVHNHCDVFGICQSADEMHAEILARIPGVRLDVVKIDGAQRQVQACLAQCARGGGLGETYGTLLHLRWPTVWTDPMLQFLRDHPYRRGR